MIDAIIAGSIRHPLWVVACSILIALGGIWALYRTPMDAIPDLSENQVIVQVEWPGKSPREIEEQVTSVLAPSLQGIPGIRVIRASSELNYSLLHLIFQDDVTFREAYQLVRERLAQAASLLPAGAVPRLAPDSLATGQIFWYTLEGGQHDLTELRALHDSLIKPQLRAIPGVAEVASVGGRKKELQLVLLPIELRKHGLAPADVEAAVAGALKAPSGQILQAANAEIVVHASTAAADARQELSGIVLRGRDGHSVRLEDVSKVTWGTDYRRGILDREGTEVTGGVVMMRAGENPLQVTRALRQAVARMQDSLPEGVRIAPFYDRVPLIEGAIGTVSKTLLEAMLTAVICILIVMRHARASLIVAVTLPLAVLASFLSLSALRRLGLLDVQTNIMSLAGIAISIGVLVDASIVMAENAMHCLRRVHGDNPVHGDSSQVVLAACQAVGRPIFFSVLILLLSFLPVFALGGLAAKMFVPMAITKSLAMLAVAVLAITLVPALSTWLLRGRMRDERESWLVRSVMDVYQPILTYCMDRPAALVWVVSATLIVGLIPVGNSFILLFALAVGLFVNGLAARTWRGAAWSFASLVIITMVAQQRMTPLGREFITPLDEGMVMDMPITVPRVSVTQAGDDLKARDMLLCRFPEVDMVVGKAGRAETAMDPAPIDMIETMVNLRPRDYWPRRKLAKTDARVVVSQLIERLAAIPEIVVPASYEERAKLSDAAIEEVWTSAEAQIREYAYQRNQEHMRGMAPKLLISLAEKVSKLLWQNGSLIAPLSSSDLASACNSIPSTHRQHLSMEAAPGDLSKILRHVTEAFRQRGLLRPDVDPYAYKPNWLIRGFVGVHVVLGGERPTIEGLLESHLASERDQLWREHMRALDAELPGRAAGVFARLSTEALLSRIRIDDPRLCEALTELRQFRQVGAPSHHHRSGPDMMEGSILHLKSAPHPVLYEIPTQVALQVAPVLSLERLAKEELIGFGGELDRALQMPGWTNVWTMPIQNRVDMLATGVNTMLGVRVLGRDLDDIVSAADRIADVLKTVPGAAEVVADPIRGKTYLEITVDPHKAAELGVSRAELNDVVQTALGGRIISNVRQGRELLPVRMLYPRESRAHAQAIGQLPVPVVGKSPKSVRLEQVALIRVAEGPATIKSENGLLRSYVRLNIRNRDIEAFVAEAQRTVQERISLPRGVFVEWTGQFEFEIAARARLAWIVPGVIALIFALLWWTYRDAMDALLMLTAVPGALAGGVLMQWLLGYTFSVTVWVGYIACLGMATSTGVIMLVYLREAVSRAGRALSESDLRQAVLDGAVHRLRPKLLTEATTVLGLAPMLWATGPGSEIIRPMATPVLGGILIADEVVDLLLPVLFYRLRVWRLRRSASVAQH